MASTLPPRTWKNGYIQPTNKATWEDDAYYNTYDGDKAHYEKPKAEGPSTSDAHNALGRCVLRTWPTIHNGTNSPEGAPAWWIPAKEVDVLICGGGPFGLQVAMCLARQGISFRIVDKAEGPLLAGRADGVQPRALEYLHAWGLAHEVAEEGPILNSTMLMKDGVKLFHGPSYQSDSRYKGIHIITQGQLERIYIRDLLRHKAVVERCTTVDSFHVQDESIEERPISATLKNIETGRLQQVRAKYLVGSDGSASSIRQQLEIPFDGITTDIYWGIIDARFKTDYPYILGWSVIVSAEHGALLVVPREDGYTRFYTQINGDRAKQLAERRQARRTASMIGETRIHDHGISPDEVLEQLNKIITPYTVEFASAISWFSVWKVSERIARAFSSPDLRIHLGGDAAHTHSTMGAFGFNSAVYDASNLAWKLGYSAKGLADPQALLSTYDPERRLFSNRVIRCSGAYLRFICNSHQPLAKLRGMGEELETHDEMLPAIDGTTEGDQAWAREFFSRHAMFLLGMEPVVVPSLICDADAKGSTGNQLEQRPTTVLSGRRAPNPRVAFGTGHTTYLYDKMTGIAQFHILVFASDMQGPVRQSLVKFQHEAFGFHGFFNKFRGKDYLNVLLVIKALPHEIDSLWKWNGTDDLELLRRYATIIYDDRTADEDAHYWYGINHARGAAVVVRPDLWVGASAWLDEPDQVNKYFAGFMIEQTIVSNT